MQTVQRVSVIVPVKGKTSTLPSTIGLIKRALSYVSYQLDQPLQYEIVLTTTNPSVISAEDRLFYQNSAPVRIYDEGADTSDAYVFRRGISQAQCPIKIILDTDFEVKPESLGNMVLKVIKGADVVSGFALSQKKKPDALFQDVTNKFLVSIQKHSPPKALIFTQEVWETMKTAEFLDKTYIIDFLYRAIEAGFDVKRYQTAQAHQKIGSFISNIRNTISANLFFLSVKLKKSQPIHTSSSDDNSMINAGVRYKKQKFITHSTLSYKDSAINSFTAKQILLYLIALEGAFLLFRFDAILLAQLVFAVLTFFYMVDVIFNFFLVYKTVRGSSELTFTPTEIAQLQDNELPIYTILCPMYKEAHMLAPFLEGIEKIEWPREKLDVLVLLEEDDIESIETIGAMQLPSYVRTLVVPTSQPKTKPKACNYGLAFTKGEYVVIFDAEDLPDPLQLKKAYLGFQKSDRNVVCLQAKLNYHNSTQNLLTRFFTAEYSWLFDISLPGLQSLNTIIPLGGTSNHFRKADLIKLNGWDPFNVTEDADLGLRIFRLGYRTAIIDSVTLEEANSQVKNWIRQRSRWIKGYMQTYLVHTRDMVPLLKARGIQALMLHFVIGGRILFIFVNPLLWIVTISYFTFRAIMGPVLEQIISPAILYASVISLIFGNYLYIIGYILGCVKRDQWGLIKFVFLSPFYLLLISVAGCMAFYQLLFKPHYWEKTIHGLHLKQNAEQPAAAPSLPENTAAKPVVNYSPFAQDLANV